MQLAPIVLFCYKRIDHLKRTVLSLQANEMAYESELIVYSDSWKSAHDKNQVLAVRGYLNTISGFKSVKIIFRKKNYGLKNSIISGVTEVLKKHSKIIVLEDDIETGRHFIKFMNSGLDRYLEDAKVWQVSGWSYPIVKSGNGGSYFHRKMNCWGWATWRDRWEKFTIEPDRIEAILLDGSERKSFNLMNTEISYQVAVGNYLGRKKTWAVLWHLCIYTNGGLCLCPLQSHTKNIGMDNSGVNSKKSNFLQSECSEIDLIAYPAEVDESEEINKLIIEYLKKIKPDTIFYAIKKMFFFIELIIFISIFWYKKNISNEKFRISLLDKFK